MFGGGNSVFNCDIRDLRTDNVVSMYGMFQYNEKFNNGFGATSLMYYGDSNSIKWNVTNVRDASYMFFGAKSFNSVLIKLDFHPSCSYYGFNRNARPQEAFFYESRFDDFGYFTYWAQTSARPKINGTKMPESEFTS
jgi:hypothetical protein